jgi:U3 small nucleolar RNA-associated protein 23
MNAIVMEKPNHLTQKFASNANEQQIELPVHEFKILKQLKRKELHQNEDEVKQTVKKRKGPKGPNPLSCKKKKKKVVNNSNNNQIIDSKECQKSKRKRYRNRVPKHIKKMFDRIETHLNQN